MYGISKCEKCGKEFKWKRPSHQIKAKLCSNKCKPKYYNDKESLEYKIKLYNERVVKKEGCWDWLGIIDTNQGYAKVQFKRENISAHRLSWIIHYGDIPKDKQINHHCDNRKCTNPEHLYLGTQKQNEEDKLKRNRQAKGSINGSAKLNEYQVKEIKELLREGKSQYFLSEKYNISYPTINNIKNEKSWRHVK